MVYSISLTGFVYPVVAHAVWSKNGFLSAHNVNPLWGTGMIDFAGSGVVHTTGGTTAIFATIVLGPRKGRFYDNRGNPLKKPIEFPGHSVALQVCWLVVGSAAGWILTLCESSVSWWCGHRSLMNETSRVVVQFLCVRCTSRLTQYRTRTHSIDSNTDARNLHSLVRLVR